MNATLEAMAQALFQSWFVNLDPIRANSGSEPTVAKQVAADAGWDTRSLDEIAHYLNGVALQKYPPGDGPTLPVIKIAQLRKGSTIDAGRCNSDLPPAYIVQDGDVLFSWSGTLEVELWCGGVGALNQHLFKVTSKEFPKWFYYLWTRHHLDEFRRIAAAKATTMGHIQRSHLSAAKVIVPPKAVLEEMSLSMSPLVEKIILNRVQSRNHVALRDALLPKLLIGDLELEDAERIVEDV
ncbi:hypothetical protein CI15_07120 [Paraburkholderia monticola]|uniref:Type I restriction modification DNA specificity domain-containing protein n=2 Tax=Paraburkholderia monticola TaxID=1399968 RepID=A0A149PYX1_9BURK|nr:hypothetical protein CI15_07120 [Paraburkholderia monticola]